MPLWLQKNKRPLVLFLNVSIGVILLIDSAIHWQAHQVLLEKKRFDGYEEVVHALQTGQLHADSKGDITLPKHLEWLTPEGHVYEVRKMNLADGTAFKSAKAYWLFPTFEVVLDSGEPGERYIHDAINGYIYSAVPPLKHTWLTNDNLDADVIVSNSTRPVNSHWWFAGDSVEYN